MVFKLGNLDHHCLDVCLGPVVSHLQGRGPVAVAILTTGACPLCTALDVVRSGGLVFLLHLVQACLVYNRLVRIRGCWSVRLASLRQHHGSGGVQDKLWGSDFGTPNIASLESRNGSKQTPLLLQTMRGTKEKDSENYQETPTTLGSRKGQGIMVVRRIGWHYRRKMKLT